MSTLVIPTFDDPFYTQTTVLEGVSYVLTFKYNQRENAWYFDIAQADATPIISGVKIICNRPLTRRFASISKPPGEFLAISNNGDNTLPGAGELGDGKRVTLLYLTSDELKAV